MRGLYDDKGSLIGWAVWHNNAWVATTLSGKISEPEKRPERLVPGVPVERQIRPNARHNKRVEAMLAMKLRTPDG